jgi:DNA (cytosine-5)-methyltransferase 3A
MHYVRALKESGCKYFLYENNYSIHNNIKKFISEQLGVQPIMINSALVSAQQRKRCYWTNIPNVSQPDDKGILLKDILESGVPWQDKSYCMTASYNGAIFKNTLERSQRTMIAEPVGVAQRGRYISSGNRSKKAEGGTYQAIEPRKDGKANCLTAVQKDSMVAMPIRLGHIGKSEGQANRVYSVRGKSVCLQAQAGGGGAKTGLYKIDLPDGDYIIRKLTPVECERLQTLPDGYTSGISNTQRYKCIGNGWTVDVIAHILKNLK